MYIMHQAREANSQGYVRLKGDRFVYISGGCNVIPFKTFLSAYTKNK